MCGGVGAWGGGVPGDPEIWAWSGLTRVSDGRSIHLMRGSIRDFPNHATFREKGAKLACADKL